MKNWQERTHMLIGEKGIVQLFNAHIAVFGIGGVGGHACEALIRAGIGNISIVDNDTVSESNLNRQIIALKSTVGQNKVDIMANRARDINPDININPIQEFLLPDNINEVFSNIKKTDYIIDAIDAVSAKLALASYAKEHGIKIISSMGTGNKFDPLRLKIGDINETSVCPLARVMRRELKKAGIERLTVVYSDEAPQKTDRTPGSMSYVPSTAGLFIAAYVVNDILDGFN